VLTVLSFSNQFAKLSKKLVIPGGMRVGKSEAGVTEINTGGGGGGGAIHLDDDEEGGLC
jgi:hypothetical protein